MNERIQVHLTILEWIWLCEQHDDDVYKNSNALKFFYWIFEAWSNEKIQFCFCEEECDELFMRSLENFDIQNLLVYYHTQQAVVNILTISIIKFNLALKTRVIQFFILPQIFQILLLSNFSFSQNFFFSASIVNPLCLFKKTFSWQMCDLNFHISSLDILALM